VDRFFSINSFLLVQMNFPNLIYIGSSPLGVSVLNNLEEDEFIFPITK